MDKEEYRVRLESIRMLAEQRDFHAAAQIADTVDWKRVKSVRTLLMVAEIYEADTQYEKANRILQFAYWRSHTSKTVLYRLTEINIKLGSYSDALKYCAEFEILAPKDSTRLLLRYKLLTARKDSLSDRIKLLEQYRETDFTEKWAYELARLRANIIKIGNKAMFIKLTIANSGICFLSMNALIAPNRVVIIKNIK